MSASFTDTRRPSLLPVETISPHETNTVGTSTGTWQHALKTAIRDAATLCQTLELPTNLIAEASRAGKAFPVFAPLGYVARMRPRDPNDPLLRQVLPLAAEDDLAPGYTADPVGDLAAQRTAGLLQKYPGRVLMVTTGACAVHCRYCFRRHFPYHEGPRSLADWQPALETIAADASIHEVILSGGDPLTIADPQLEALVDEFQAIPHLRRLRIHTRLPIIIPQRVTDRLLAWLTGSRLTPIMVVHANHAQEIDDSVEEALGRLVSAGIPTLNQAVLLRGVNDTLDALTNLCERLVDLRVMPYYLHQLDHVAGAAHFAVDESRGRELIAGLRARLPGYAVPQYVCELAGHGHKTPL